MSPKFEFYEKVIVASPDPEVAEVNGEQGAILGRSEKPDINGLCRYGVFIYRDEIVWDLNESELKATGEFDTRENLYGVKA